MQSTIPLSVVTPLSPNQPSSLPGRTRPQQSPGSTTAPPPSGNWQTEGYPEFTKWMSGSNDCFVVRKFSQLCARSILLLQDDLMQLETQLLMYDNYSRSQPRGQGGTGSFRIDQNEKGNPRDRLMRDITLKLKEYYELLNLATAIKGRPGAQDFQVQNVENWFHNRAGAIHQDERTFIREKGDLMTLTPKSKSLFRQWLERYSGIRNWFRLQDDTDRVDRVQSKSTSYFSDRWFEQGISFATVAVGLGMLLGPMWGLDQLESSTKKLGIITGFVVLFSLLLFASSTSASRGYEVLAATAAYAAVLAIFLQINGRGY